MIQLRHFASLRERLGIGDEAVTLPDGVDTVAGLQDRAGAMASFIGLVRDLNEGEDISGMTLEHYPGMTEKVPEVRGGEPTATSSVSTHVISDPFPRVLLHPSC